MQKQVSSNGLLIVVELGAEWPSALQAELAVPARRVFAQEESESCAAFAHLQLIASDRNEGRSRAPLTTLARELASEWQSAAIATELRFIPDAECVSAPLVSAGSSEPSARSAKRGRGKDSARRVA